MLRRQFAHRELRAETHCLRRHIAFAQQRAAHLIEKCQLLIRTCSRVVCHIVGDAREPIKSENDPAMARGDKKGRDGKILVAVALS